MEDGDVPLLGGSRSIVTRRGDVVFREAAPWSRTVIALLRHLEAVGFDHAPRVVSGGFDPSGREMLSFVEGTFVHPKAWNDDALPALGRMLRELHEATASFRPDDTPQWQSWFGRRLGIPSVIGHCDTGPWNIVSRDQMPVALIDWEVAGPVDPRVELCQACWLNAHLVDDDIAELHGFPSVEMRARQLCMLLDGYGLSRRERIGFIDLIRDFVVLCAADIATEARVTRDATVNPRLWGIAWRARSAGWITRHRSTLERVLNASA